MGNSIVLVGPMGVGKTTIGKKLAKSMGVSFLDTDKVFISKHGSINRIFDSQGEEYFRDLESEVLAECLNSSGVVSTGGGVVLREANREALKSATVIYLSTTGKHIGARLLAGNRPLIKNGMSDWQRIYDQRKPLYESVADHEVATSGKPLATIVEEILGLVGND